MFRILSFCVLLYPWLLNAQDEQAGRIYISRDKGVTWERADDGFPGNDVVNTWLVNDGVVFAGTDSHGVMKWSGSHWQPASTQLHGLRVISMLYHQDVLFSGVYNDGVYYSGDHGSTWTRAVRGFQNANVRALHAVDNLVFAGTNDGIYVANMPAMKWRPVKTGFQVNAFAADRDHLYAATQLGLLRSSDNGTSWQWIYDKGAVYRIGLSNGEIHLLDYFGSSVRSTAEPFIWITDSGYIPFSTYFRLTSSSVKMFAPDWQNVIVHPLSRRGLPPDAGLRDLLHTPAGLLAAAGYRRSKQQ